MHGLTERINDSAIAQYDEHRRHAERIASRQVALDEDKALSYAFLLGERESFTDEETEQLFNVRYRPAVESELRRARYDYQSNIYNAYDYKERNLDRMIGQAIIDALNDGVTINIPKEKK